MDYEKKYKEALERARQFFEKPYLEDSAGIVGYIFPELRESEDERARKEMVEYCYKRMNNEFPSITIHQVKRWLTWLEKQELKSNPYSGVSFSYNGNIWGMCARDNGVEILFDGELKAFLSSEKSFIYPTRPQPVLEPIKEEKAGNNNKVETKFKVGDWVVSPNGVYWHIDEIQNGRYEVTADTGQCGNWPLDTNIYRLWTIQDAKDGDVLVDGLGNICIYQEPSTKLMYHSYCYGNHKCFIDMGGSHKIVGTCPATKEQRDTLMKAMTDAGYTFDFEKKELKKIEQNPAWSEEDDQYLLVCKNALAKYQVSDKWDATIISRWLEDKLKSLRPQNRWKPSEEQMDN